MSLGWQVLEHPLQEQGQGKPRALQEGCQVGLSAAKQCVKVIIKHVDREQGLAGSGAPAAGAGEGKPWALLGGVPGGPVRSQTVCKSDYKTLLM